MKTLLLNSTLETLSFITDRKAIRLLVKDKVDVLAEWTGVKYYYAEGFIELPAVLKLKHEITRRSIKLPFSRSAVFKRDKFICQLCGKFCNSQEITLDHVIPKSRNGRHSFENCIAACKKCNLEKGSQTLNEVGMKLIREPFTPEGYLLVLPKEEDFHKSWSLFLPSDDYV